MVGVGDSTHDYTEAGLALNAVGELVAVIRSGDYSANSYCNLEIRQSADLGVT